MRARIVFLAAALLAGAIALQAGTILYTYDAAGRLIKADYGNGKSITYTYDANGNLLSRVVTVPPTCALTCEASATPPRGPVPLGVAFQATVQATGCTQAPSLLWEFGDGATSTQSNPVHTYGVMGVYAWKVTVAADGVTCERGGTVTVGPGDPGDCDGDGAVAINEVQRAINMFLGTQVPACNVDCGGEGEVTIGDVQRVINAFLGNSSHAVTFSAIPTSVAVGATSALSGSVTGPGALSWVIVQTGGTGAGTVTPPSGAGGTVAATFTAMAPGPVTLRLGGGNPCGGAATEISLTVTP